MRPSSLALVAATLVAGGAVGAARAEDPPFIGWTAVLPGLSPGYDPDDPNLCKQGHPQCVDAVIHEMTKRFVPLADACDHDAIFALTYLRTTEEYYKASLEPGFFADPAFVNHEDAVFASTYFDAYDAWHGGAKSDVPAAWRVAFDAADERKVTALGNVFLAMNAHIQRDLPYVLHSIGLVAPDGTSRKADHDKVDAFLNQVAGDLFLELARRFDPTADDAFAFPGTLDDFLSFQLVAVWREVAWRHAEALAWASTDAERHLVVAEIEGYAASQAYALKLLFHYGLLQSSAPRDAFCAVHHWDP